MTKLPNKEFRQMIPLLREKGFYEYEQQRPISWPEYNLSQIEDAKETLKFIRDSVDQCKVLVLKGKRGKPLTNPKTLAKAVLVSEFLGFTERSAEGWLDILGLFVGIRKHIDERVIGDAYDKLEVVYLLKQVFDNVKKSDGKLSGDGTGLETSRKQNYESSKKYGHYMTCIVDSREVVQAFDVSGEQELHAMHKLISEVEGSSIRLDAGFVDRKLTNKIAARGMVPYIFPKANLNLNGSPAWKAMYVELYLDVMQWLTEYHQRSHSESFNSSFKRRNKLVSKIRSMCQLSQITARIIIHNFRRLSYFNKLADTS